QEGACDPQGINHDRCDRVARPANHQMPWANARSSPACLSPRLFSFVCEPAYSGAKPGVINAGLLWLFYSMGGQYEHRTPKREQNSTGSREGAGYRSASDKAASEPAAASGAQVRYLHHE